jgi:imidazolonepropionase
MRILFKNIKQLIGTQHPQLPLRGKDLKHLPTIENAFVIVQNGLIEAFGTLEDLTFAADVFTTIIDCANGCILPTWCDSHTHLVFAQSRENEFIEKLKGKSYAEIAANGGGILNSAKILEHTSIEDLYILAWNRLQELIGLGTGAIEIKSGYGLTTQAELKMLSVIQMLKKNAPIPIKASFLAAHTFPTPYKDNQQGYIDLIIEEMLPTIAKENLADYVDVFCETGFFSVQQMEQIVIAAKKYGLLPKLHVNQLNSIGGLQKAIALNAVSVDHLETMTDADIVDVAASATIATLLPTAAYFLRMPFQPVRKLLDAGAAVALASDFNPGSSPSGNMNMVVSMSCIQMKMLPEEAINSATINGAFAMQVHNEVGSIAVGKKANFILTKDIPSIAYLPYCFGSNLIAAVYINGKKHHYV